MNRRIRLTRHFVPRRCFSLSAVRREARDISQLPDRIYPEYLETQNTDLLSLDWPSPPRNILITQKRNVPAITASLIEYANHIHTTYPGTSLVFRPQTASEVESSLSFPIYTSAQAHEAPGSGLADKVDLICTLGGDGTILRASSLFASCERVPPILSFSMGTLGFLGEWKFKEYKRAFREVYMSGAGAGYGSRLLQEDDAPKPQQPEEKTLAFAKENNDRGGQLSGWSSVRGKSMGPGRGARVLLRNRLKVSVTDAQGSQVNASQPDSGARGGAYAMNEVILHRGREPHLVVIEVFIGGRFLTEAVADGMIISTPTGSTAYSLSSGGSIVHPLVPSLSLTPICPRSLSFRPLILPANTPITLRLSENNRSDEIEISVDGVRMKKALSRGMQVHVLGEDLLKNGQDDARGGRSWRGGVPSIVRGSNSGLGADEDHWVGGLNGLLKFNYPFGDSTTK